MRYTKPKVVVTGIDGKLGQVVVPMLAAEGYIVLGLGRDVELSDYTSVFNKLRYSSGKIEGYIALAGMYYTGDDEYAYRSNVQANIQSAKTPIDVLRDLELLTSYPTMVAIGAATDFTPEQVKIAPYYYSSKALLKTYWEAAPPYNGYWHFIEPKTALDTAEKREDIAHQIINALNIPLANEEIA